MGSSSLGFGSLLIPFVLAIGAAQAEQSVPARERFETVAGSGSNKELFVGADPFDEILVFTTSIDNCKLRAGRSRMTRAELALLTSSCGCKRRSTSRINGPLGGPSRALPNLLASRNTLFLVLVTLV